MLDHIKRIKYLIVSSPSFYLNGETDQSSNNDGTRRIPTSESSESNMSQRIFQISNFFNALGTKNLSAPFGIRLSRR